MKRLFLLVLVVTALFLFTGCNESTSSDESATLIVESFPEGATIILDGEAVRAVTPATLEVDPGYHEVRLVLVGYEDYYVGVELDDGDTFAILAVMQVSLSTSLIVNTTPTGASIYIDGSYTGETSPVTFTNILPGYHFVRLYKPGYNEVVLYVYIEENIPYYITETLSYPVPPYPVINIYSPYDGEHFVDNVIYVEGYIVLDTGASFTGETAILSINGVDSEISVDYSGNFYETISIAAGENDLQVRANGPYGDTGVSSIVTVYGDFVAPEIEVVLWWNTPTADLDLHAWNPAGEHCYYGNPIISDGFLDIDDTEGFGPETFAVQTANLGIYEIQINSFSLDSDDYSDASIQVFFDGALMETYGPHHFITDDYNGTDPEAWWEVCTIEVVNGRASITHKLPSEEIREKIAFDKANLIEK
jgi:PEGA domain